MTKFDEYREDNRREVKSAKGGLPASLWDTYSAFTNSQGGVIILGVRENEDKSWQTTGLQNPAKIYKEFWDMIHNPVKVSLNLLTDDDVELYDVGGDTIMMIHVPMARREEKPIYLNDNIFKYTYRRNGEGDYRCTKSQVLAMLQL